MGGGAIRKRSGGRRFRGSIIAEGRRATPAPARPAGALAHLSGRAGPERVPAEMAAADSGQRRRPGRLAGHGQAGPARPLIASSLSPSAGAAGGAGTSSEAGARPLRRAGWFEGLFGPRERPSERARIDRRHALGFPDRGVASGCWRPKRWPIPGATRRPKRPARRRCSRSRSRAVRAACRPPPGNSRRSGGRGRPSACRRPA